MSSKGSIFLTSDNEHCYEETNEHDGDRFRIYLEIDPKNITEIDYDEEGLLVGIRGDSEMANQLRKCRR